MSKSAKLISCLIQEIKSIQNEDGSFSAYIFETRRETLTVFPTILTTGILSDLSLPLLDHVVNKANSFIYNNINADLCQNYWKSGSYESVSRKYPDDLDDTALTNRLFIYDSHDKLFDRFIRSLKCADHGYGGPFNTWILPDSISSALIQDPHWIDVDPVVNANIYYCVKAMGIVPAGLLAYLRECLLRENFASKYYPNQAHVVYFISRALENDLDAYEKERLRTFLTRNASKKLVSTTHANNLLSGAMLLSSLIRLGADKVIINKYYCAMLDFIHRKTYASPFYIESIKGGLVEKVDSLSTTLSITLEALKLYEQNRS